MALDAISVQMLHCTTDAHRLYSPPRPYRHHPILQLRPVRIVAHPRPRKPIPSLTVQPSHGCCSSHVEGTQVPKTGVPPQTV
ncbi:uncharacterized protein LOC121720703 isoform X4 [Alosa sapidissima]|uniref:uncharacterized protein LOC121720703 isoform X4 n=1 Tax=Alosa sapidissima TaxID=34773 RepID=UPI001C0824F3|nr:uncharacterized protein LOC121720703 isoform X4 [Alosa sapidissima]